MGASRSQGQATRCANCDFIERPAGSLSLDQKVAAELEAYSTCHVSAACMPRGLTQPRGTPADATEASIDEHLRQLSHPVHRVYGHGVSRVLRGMNEQAYCRLSLGRITGRLVEMDHRVASASTAIDLRT